ncbi:hypothetical protein [Microbulbifer sp. THAF38]|uniref:hypothetical protein n=1 Tax=Microbulbifer sp. THAF38 TaxID=2587856 RepID=UPI0012685B9C|nr:hypothetical protein [Microbulbifer sp. THAF38]
MSSGAAAPNHFLNAVNLQGDHSAFAIIVHPLEAAAVRAVGEARIVAALRNQAGFIKDGVPLTAAQVSTHAAVVIALIAGIAGIIVVHLLNNSLNTSLIEACLAQAIEAILFSAL